MHPLQGGVEHQGGTERRDRLEGSEEIPMLAILPRKWESLKSRRLMGVEIR